MTQEHGCVVQSVDDHSHRPISPNFPFQVNVGAHNFKINWCVTVAVSIIHLHLNNEISLECEGHLI
jgi:hypothetical protein